MLFLTNHVKSKNYSVKCSEGHSEDSCTENQDHNDATDLDDYESGQDIKEETKYKSVETFYVSADSEQGESSMEYDEMQLEAANEDTEENVEIFSEVPENEYPLENENAELFIVEDQESLDEEEEEVDTVEQDIRPASPIIETKITSPQISSKKRNASEDDPVAQNEIPQKKMKVDTPKYSPAKVKSGLPAIIKSEDDEDTAFGNFIACMIKKVPRKLKTKIKLKLMQTFQEFEVEHDL